MQEEEGSVVQFADYLSSTSHVEYLVYEYFLGMAQEYVVKGVERGDKFVSLAMKIQEVRSCSLLIEAMARVRNCMGEVTEMTCW